MGCLKFLPNFLMQNKTFLGSDRILFYLLHGFLFALLLFSFVVVLIDLTNLNLYVTTQHPHGMSTCLTVVRQQESH